MILILNFITLIEKSSYKYEKRMFTSIYKVNYIINTDICWIQIKYGFSKVRILLENSFCLKPHSHIMSPI